MSQKIGAESNYEALGARRETSTDDSGNSPQLALIATRVEDAGTEIL